MRTGKIIFFSAGQIWKADTLNFLKMCVKSPPTPPEEGGGFHFLAHGVKQVVFQFIKKKIVQWLNELLI